MNFLPVCLNIRKSRILVVGGGRMALHKLQPLLLYTRRITLCSPKVEEKLRSLRLKILEVPFTADLLDDFDLVYACTEDRRLNRRIGREARKRRILVNVADDPEVCDFVSPAVFKKGRMTVAVSSDATKVKKAIDWRNQIRQLLS
jgi:siroheme synthase-like protein